MRKLSSLAALVVLGITGCAATVEPMPTPDGKQGFLIGCDGSADSWASCYKAATKQCGGGTYTVVNQNESSTPTNFGPLVRRHLIVQCK